MQITRKQLERYGNLLIEQRRLNDRAEDLLSEQEEIKKRTVRDTVQASESEFPYIQRSVSIEGLSGDEDKINKRIIDMELNRVRAMQDANDLALSEIRQAVDEIDDEYIKAIVTYRVIRGMSWRQVAFRMGGGITDSGVKMAYRRYFAKLC